MCGRYQLVLPLEALREAFAFVNAAEPFPPRYNIAPTQPIHVVRRAANGERHLDLVRWGLQPTWVKDPAKFPLLVNARFETAAERPAFRNALRRRRALIPATGFYEWRQGASRKIPYLFEAVSPIALAGIWETWMGPNGEELDTAAILTGAAEGVPAGFHERMPLTVRHGNFAAWLDPANDDGEAALALTVREAYTARPVATLLNSARNEGVGLMTPDPDPEPDREPPDAQPRLL